MTKRKLAGGARGLALNLLLMALYVVLGRITFAASVEYGNVTSVVFVPEGVALAFAILFGPRVAPGIVLGQALLSYWSGPSVLGGLGIGLFNAAEAVLGGWLFRRWGLSRRFGRPRDVGLFAAMVLCILQPISATGGILVLLAVGMVPPEAAAWLGDAWWIRGLQKPLPSLDLVPSAWVHWWIGNSVGQLLAVPLLLAWLTPGTRRADPVRLLELAALAAGVSAGLLLLPWQSPQGFVLLLAVGYPLLIWIGLRYGLRAATVANVLATLVVVSAGVHGYGFMQQMSVPDRLFYVSFFIATGVLSSLALFALLEERRALIQQLTELASKDALTKVSNRRYFVEQAERALAQAWRAGSPVSLVLLDVDHFKRINDQYGHAAGDLALRALARCCMETLRPGDVVGRIGGEEFALLLPRADARDAAAAAERLRERVKALALHAGRSHALRMTFSAGIAQAAPQDGLDDLLRRADEAMYQAKRAGRDRIALASP